MSELRIVDVEKPTPEETTFFTALTDYNHAKAGDPGYQALNLFLRDDEGATHGALRGGSYYGWMFVELLVIREESRGQGLGSRLLQAAEEEARARGCVGVYLDTFSFQARPFYLKHGYEVFGVLEDRPPGHAHYFLKKRLDGAAGE